MRQPTSEELRAVFTEWDRRYRADPTGFMTEVEHLLGNTEQSYGAACGAYFEKLYNEMFPEQKGTVVNHAG